MRDPRCSYVVFVENPAKDLRELAAYLSELAVAGCDVVMLDSSPRFDSSERVLRWVGRHLAMPAGVDWIRAAAAFAVCEKVIVAKADVRYTPEAVGRICELLDAHPVVEPQTYLDPLSWWGGIEAGQVLVHRAVELQPEPGATFGFRRAAVRGFSTLRAQAHSAGGVFVRRESAALPQWLAQRVRDAGEDFSLPMKTAFFLALAPILLLLAVLGGIRVASGYAGLIAFSSVALAIRGRAGATTFFPLRACLFAPLWILERSVSVYWALFLKLRGTKVLAPGEEVSATGQTSTNVRHG